MTVLTKNIINMGAMQFDRFLDSKESLIKRRDYYELLIPQLSTQLSLNQSIDFLRSFHHHIDDVVGKGRLGEGLVVIPFVGKRLKPMIYEEGTAIEDALLNFSLLEESVNSLGVVGLQEQRITTPIIDANKAIEIIEKTKVRDDERFMVEQYKNKNVYWMPIISPRSKRKMLAIAGLVTEKKEKDDKTLEDYFLQTMAKAYQVQLMKESDNTFDELTGAFSRKFYDVVKDMITTEANEILGEQIGCGLIDLNMLNEANNKISYENGDKYIYASASAIISSLRNSDFVFRYGGDEFRFLSIGIGKNALERTVVNIERKSQGFTIYLPKKDFVDSTCLSTGYKISSKKDDLEEAFKDAEKQMKCKKNYFYALNGVDRRKN